MGVDKLNAVDAYEEYPHFFQVKLDLFDGPIDLLLHLVKVNELPIEKVSLAEVTDQYLNCLEEMRRFDLEIAGEYLVIAATLLSIKSSILLQEPVELVEDDSGSLVDPHDELLRRLKEAEVYKEGANSLGSRGLYGIDVFPGSASLKDVKSAPTTFKDHDPMLLGMAFQKLLKEAKGEEDVYTIELESVSIVERMMEVLNILRESSDKVQFKSLVPDLTRKSSIISTFIALLELCKRQVIHVQQETHAGIEVENIYIALAVEELDMQNLRSDFDPAIQRDAEIVNA